jgi:hypothetical protein
VVWTIPSPCPGFGPGVRCCPSSLYTFPLPGLARDCHREVSPSLGSSASAVSRGALKAFKSVASAIPPRPRGAQSYTHAARSRQGDPVTLPAGNRKKVLTTPFYLLYKSSIER